MPNIKVSQAYKNKFLSRIIGKSSSVDNLSSDTNTNNEKREDIFSDANLKTKSLSTNEIFLPASPMVSRSSSVSRINRKPLHTLRINNESTKAASYHGSFENFDRKIEIADSEKTGSDGEHAEFYNCPFISNCSWRIKGKLIDTKRYMIFNAWLSLV